MSPLSGGVCGSLALLPTLIASNDALRLALTIWALMRCCSSAGSWPNGGATCPSAIFLVGASCTWSPNALRVSARMICTTLRVPPTSSPATAFAKAYLLSALSNLIHNVPFPPGSCCSKWMRGTLLRFTYAATSAGNPATSASQRSSGVRSSPCGEDCAAVGSPTDGTRAADGA